MSLVVKTGVASFSAGALTAVTISTGLGEAVKAIMFFWTRQSADGTTDEMHFGFGCCTGTAQEWCVHGKNQDAATTSACAHLMLNNACIVDIAVGAGTTIDFQADCTTFGSGANSDQVVITPSNAPTVTTRVFWVAFGGTDITSAKAGTFSMSSGAGPTAVTDPGFTPNAVIFGGRPSTVAAGTVNTTQALWLMLGAASSTNTADQCSTMVASGAVAASMDDYGRELTNRCMNFESAASSNQGEAHVSSWDANGFTLTHDSSVAGAYLMGYLAFAGTAQWKVISETAATSVTTKAKTGVGFQPTALPLIVSASMTAGEGFVSATDVLGLSVGAYDGTTQGAVWIGEQDGNTASLSAQRQSTALAVINAAGANVVATGSSTTFPATASIQSLNPNGWTTSWTAADATAREFWVLAVAGAAAATPKSLVYQSRARAHLLRR
jgi:hypothetical protein